MRADGEAKLEQVDGMAIAGADLLPLTCGALYWPREGLLAVADLHLEKGTAFARRGVFLPPYDTMHTLQALAQAVARFAPRIVVALGDSFHDCAGHARLDVEARGLLAACQAGRDWIWVAGNHDPEPPVGVGGGATAELRVGGLTFRHEPQTGASGEIAGHLHPVGKVRGHGRAVRRRCFATDDARLVLPAFGAFTGGLNVLDKAFDGLFGSDFTAWIAGAEAVYRVAPHRLLSD